jgi:hypothetical protein
MASQWRRCEPDGADAYYFNIDTHEASWSLPEGLSEADIRPFGVEDEVAAGTTAPCPQLAARVAAWEPCLWACARHRDRYVCCCACCLFAAVVAASIVRWCESCEIDRCRPHPFLACLCLSRVLAPTIACNFL